MTTLRERLAQMGEVVRDHEETFIPDLDLPGETPQMKVSANVAAALVAVADAVAKPAAYAVAAEEVYQVLRCYSAGLIDRARTDAEENEIRQALWAFETARKPLEQALDALAAALGVPR